MPNIPVRIKRYPNRRLYASHTSSYVSVAEIEELIRSGTDVEIVDSQTGEDLTRAILIQVIADRHPDKIAMFPKAMLHSMLRANDVMVNFLQDYFRNSLAYLDYFQQHGGAGPLKQPMHWMRAWLEGWSKPAIGGAASAQTSQDGAPKESAAEADEVLLVERIGQLEQRIAELEKEKQQRS